MATKRTGTRLKREKKKSKVSRSVESAMFWAKVFATKYDLVLAVCDEELLERDAGQRIHSNEIDAEGHHRKPHGLSSGRIGREKWFYSERKYYSY